MVKIILKGIKKDELHSLRTFKITEFQAGFILIKDGVQITLSSREQSKKFSEALK